VERAAGGQDRVSDIRICGLIRSAFRTQLTHAHHSRPCIRVGPDGSAMRVNGLTIFALFEEDTSVYGPDEEIGDNGEAALVPRLHCTEHSGEWYAWGRSASV
jgi:hypothetical protein